MQGLIAKLLSGLTDIVVNVCLTLIAPMAIAFLAAQFNKTRIGKRTMLDDEIFKALNVAVSNVGRSVAKKYKELNADGILTDAEKKELQALALKGARENLSPEANRLFKKYTPEKAQNIVRYIVDQLN